MKRPGFTLVELIIYVAIVGVFMAAVFSLVLQYIGTAQKVRSYQEVQQNGRFAMQRLVQEIRAAGDLNAGTSIFGINPGVLSLASDDATKNPTVFDVSSGRLRIKQGSAAALPLTSEKVRVTNLVFTDLEVSSKTKNIKIQLTVQHYNPANVTMFDSQVSLESTAVIREQQE